MAEWFDAGAVEAIGDPGSRGFEHRGTGFFVVRKDGALHAWRNRCPHTGAPLEWQPDQFLDLDGGFIQCAIHGALFRTADGYCVRGPCAGRALDPLPLEVREGRVYVDVSALAD